jgi:hypothetical protein
MTIDTHLRSYAQAPLPLFPSSARDEQKETISKLTLVHKCRVDYNIIRITQTLVKVTYRILNFAESSPIAALVALLPLVVVGLPTMLFVAVCIFLLPPNTERCFSGLYEQRSNLGQKIREKINNEPQNSNRRAYVNLCWKIYYDSTLTVDFLEDTQAVEAFAEFVSAEDPDAMEIFKRFTKEEQEYILSYELEDIREDSNGEVPMVK